MLRMPDVNYSSLDNAIALRSNSDNIRNAAQSDKANYLIKNKQLDINLTSNVLNSVTNLGSIISQQITASEQQSLSLFLDQQSKEYSQAYYTSIANGKTQFKQNQETGNYQLIVDQDLVDMQSKMVQAVQSLGYSDSVTTAGIQSLNTMFASGNESAFKLAYQQLQANTEEAFTKNMALAMNSDAILPEGDYTNIYRAINSRTDKDDAWKATEFETQKIIVDFAKSKNIINDEALINGTSSALDLARTLKDKYGFQQGDYETLASIARQTGAIETANIVQKNVDYFNQEVSAGKSPGATISDIEKTIKGYSQERKDAVTSALSAAHATYATNQVAPYLSDLSSCSAEELIMRKDLLQNMDYVFVQGNDTVKNIQNKAIAQIDNYLSDWETLGKNVNSASTKEIAERVATQKLIQEDTFNSFMKGDISGDEALTSLSLSSNVDGSIEDDFNAQTFMDKVAKSIPSPWQETAKNFLDSFELDFVRSLGIKVDENGKYENLTTEQQLDLDLAKKSANASIIELFRSTSGNSMTNEQFKNELANVSKTRTAKVYDVLSAPLIGNTPEQITNSALDKQEEFKKLDNIVFYNSNTGKYEWNAPKEVEDAFHNMSLSLKDILTNNGLKVEGMEDFLTIDGKTYPIPVWSDTNGNRYTVDSEYIYQVKDNSLLKYKPIDMQSKPESTPATITSGNDEFTDNMSLYNTVKDEQNNKQVKDLSKTSDKQEQKPVEKSETSTTKDIPTIDTTKANTETKSIVEKITARLWDLMNGDWLHQFAINLGGKK